jgi:hypothetical protein
MKHGVEAFELLRVDATLVRVPLDFESAQRAVVSHEAHDFMSVVGERFDERAADESVRTADEDFHAA